MEQPSELDILLSTYSDAFKEAFGFRPTRINGITSENIQGELDWLARIAAQRAEREDEAWVEQEEPTVYSLFYGEE